MLVITAADAAKEWEPTGDFGAGETRPELLRSRLLAGAVAAGLSLHVEAWEVEEDPEGCQDVVHPDLRADFAALYGAFSPDAPFQTTEIEGRSYVIFAFPHGD